MLKYRLLFGTLIAAFLCALVIAGAWWDGSLTSSPDDDRPVQGTLLCIFLCLLLIPAHLELANFLKVKGIRLPLVTTVMGSIVLSSRCYWNQLFSVPPDGPWVLMAFCFMLIVYAHYRQGGYEGMLLNCGGAALALLYLGLFSSFLIAIRVEYGVWPLLMCVTVVKSSDIGAYTVGRLFGKHKLAPRLSPGKTWEGMIGAVVFAVIVAVVFADRCNMMGRGLAIFFGMCMAVMGQMGDLIESMMKRDAQMKDSSTRIPGFGGVLDLMDSPLVIAPFAYCFFMISA
jgi:phosphatidate cytidylyltransferase